MALRRRRVLVVDLAAALLLAGCATGPITASSTAGPPSIGPSSALPGVTPSAAASIQSGGGWAGPTSGAKRARESGLIVFVAADLTNGGIAGVADGVVQAARAMGWTVRVIDGEGSADGRATALQAAVAAEPIGIVIGGFDPSEQLDTIREAQADHIPLVGWHAGSQPGADPSGTLFTNVSTTPAQVATIAADFVISDSHGTAGVAIFTDSHYQIALDKADLMKSRIEACPGCKVLAYRDTPIADSTARMPLIVADLHHQFGASLTYLLGINGNYFGGARLGLMADGVTGAEPPYAVAAGDGDQHEFDRIRNGDYQKASVAEPLYLQGWQIVDELNRALAGQPPSMFIAPPGLITSANVPAPGGVWDPNSSYAANYRRIWGVGS